VGLVADHTRVYYFLNDGKEEVFCSSADWMDRNLYRRVESCFPIEEKKLRERVVKELGYYLQDNMQAWELQSDGSYVRSERGDAEPSSAQLTLLRELSAAE